MQAHDVKKCSSWSLHTSPRYWAIDSGSLRCARAIIEELRADSRNTFELTQFSTGDVLT